MQKNFIKYVIGMAAGLWMTPVLAFAADEYSVMGFDGNVTTIEDPMLTKVVENIIATDGQEIADKYLEAVASGDYSEFYQITGDKTETARRSSYMLIDGEDMSDDFITIAQTTETWAQTIAGPDYTIPEVGQMITDMGYEASNLGAQTYFLDILMGNAVRPDGVNPVYRLSEMDLQTKNMEDIEWFNKGIIVEYEDMPLTTFQLDLAKQYGLEVKKASEVYSDEQPAKTPEAETEITETEIEEKEQETVENTTTEQVAPEEEDLTVPQFVLLTAAVIALGIAAAVFIFFGIKTIHSDKSRK